jgi:hypothetical protein
MKKQIVKIMADGISNDITVEADTHEQAVEQLAAGFHIKNEAGQMMSEEVTIFDEFGVEAHKISNILCE